MGLIRHTWINPARAGRITVVLCEAHDRSVLRTLRRLGIGSGGCDAPAGSGPCTFCAGRTEVSR